MRMDPKLVEATDRWRAQLDAREDRRALQTFSADIIPLILPDLRARFLAEYPDRAGAGRYPGLVSLLGYTPDTTILAARFTAARALVVLHTPETAHLLQEVHAGCGLAEGAIAGIQFDRDRLERIGEAVDQSLDTLRGVVGDGGPIAVEVTGGTKPMGSYAHIAAALRGLDTLYIDYDQYDPRHRKPLPASLRVRLLRTPVLRSAADPRLLALAERLAALDAELRELARDEGAGAVGREALARVTAEAHALALLAARLRDAATG